MQINFKNFKYEKTDTLIPGSVSFTGPVIETEGTGGTINLVSQVIEKLVSDSQQPVDRVKVGTAIDGEIPVTSSDIDLWALMLNKTASAGAVALNATETPTCLDNYAITFETDIACDDTYTTQTWVITGLHFQGDVNATFNPNDAYYLPLMVKSTKDSQLTITNS